MSVVLLQTMCWTTVQEVGADEVIDYTCADFVKELKNRPVDVVVDSLGGASITNNAL